MGQQHNIYRCTSGSQTRAITECDHTPPPAHCNRAGFGQIWTNLCPGTDGHENCICTTLYVHKHYV